MGGRERKMATIGFDRQWVFKMQAVNPVIDHL
jgi:hypothetical protein